MDQSRSHRHRSATVSWQDTRSASKILAELKRANLLSRKIHLFSQILEMPFTESAIHTALRHLRTRDPVMRTIIKDVGDFTLRTEHNRFSMLVRSIIAQQISAGAARSIHNRLEQIFTPKALTPENMLQFDVEEIRSVGMSPQKASYVFDLARKTHDGMIQLRTIGRQSDEGVIEQLCQVKGIGRWTAQMFLIFALGRCDVFPHDDLGVRIAIRDRYGFDGLPDKDTSMEIAAPWRPYASVASWYCWRSLEVRIPVK